MFEHKTHGDEIVASFRKIGRFGGSLHDFAVGKAPIAELELRGVHQNRIHFQTGKTNGRKMAFDQLKQATGTAAAVQIIDPVAQSVFEQDFFFPAPEQIHLGVEPAYFSLGVGRERTDVVGAVFRGDAGGGGHRVSWLWAFTEVDAIEREVRRANKNYSWPARQADWLFPKSGVKCASIGVAEWPTVGWWAPYGTDR